MRRRSEIAVAGCVALAFATTLTILTLHGRASRVYSAPATISVEDAGEAYAFWRARGVQGRILVHFDRHLFAERPDTLEPLERLEARLGAANFVTAGVRAGVLRAIYHVVPDEAWSDVERGLERRAATSAFVERDGQRYRTVFLGAPVTITRLRDLPRVDEPVLADVNLDLFPGPGVPAPPAGPLTTDLVVRWGGGPQALGVRP